jgi:hypothetical protein
MASKLATFRTDDETWDSFQAKAKRNGTNASALLQRFVRDYLDDKLDSRIDSHAAPDVDIQVIINEAIAPLVARLEALETNRSEAVAPTKKVEDSCLTELQTEIKRLNNAIAIKDNEIEHHKKEISNKTHKINDLQGEIQEYHRGQLEKDGIFLPPREETVLTISGNFTQKELDKAAKKGAKKPSTIEAPIVENPLPDETLSDVIATTKKQITYNLNHDGSVILRSLRGITDKLLKRMSDDELKAIGLFKTLRGKDEKFFPNDETLELRYQEKSKPSAATAKPKSTKKRSAKSDADRRFTLQEAVDFYNSAHPSDRPLKTNSLKQNAKLYGFMIKERGSGMYALIDS